MTRDTNSEITSPDPRVVFDTQINVLGDPKSKVSRLREVPFSKLVLLHFKGTFQDFLGFRPPDGDMTSDLLVSPDSKRSNSVAGLGSYRSLTSKLFEDLGG